MTSYLFTVKSRLNHLFLHFIIMLFRIYIFINLNVSCLFCVCYYQIYDKYHNNIEAIFHNIHYYLITCTINRQISSISF